MEVACAYIIPPVLRGVAVVQCRHMPGASQQLGAGLEWELVKVMSGRASRTLSFQPLHAQQLHQREHGA